MVEKLFERRLVNRLLPYMDSKECVAIYGSRQVGKTTLLKYIIKHHIKENAINDRRSETGGIL